MQKNDIAALHMAENVVGNNIAIPVFPIVWINVPKNERKRILFCNIAVDRTVRRAQQRGTFSRQRFYFICGIVYNSIVLLPGVS